MSHIAEILLLGHTHHDVGYTNSPRIVDPLHRRIVGQVLDLCDAPADDGRPGDEGPGDEGPDDDGSGDDRALMRWTFEVARPVLGFVRNARKADVARLRRLVDSGRISVTGGYLNMTQLPGEHELDAAYEQLDVLRSAGITVRTEQHGDVNGIAWGAVPAMRRAGIERLVMALNPDHGRPPFEQPTGFWWKGSDGAPIFVWLSTHYGVGEQWGIIDADVAAAERHITAFVERLETRSDYPYDVAIVHAANDNRWPTTRFLDVVRHWNARHPDVPMRTATVDEALDRIVAQAERADVPVVTGEWSDWWSHGHGSTARELSVYRAARSFALAAQTTTGLALLRGDGEVDLATVIGHRRGPVRLRGPGELATDLAAVDEQLLLFGEHTWGSWESFSKPHSVFTHSHWNAKAGFAYAAYDLGRDLAIEGLFRLLASGGGTAGTAPAAGDSSVVVVNPTARTRTEPVTVEVDGIHQRIVVVREVPPFGLTRVAVPAEPRSAGTGREVSTDRYRVIVDPARGGVVSLVDTVTGRELVDTAAGPGLGSVVIEQVPQGCDHPMTTDPKNFHPDHPGPDFMRTVATSESAPQITEAGDHLAMTWRTAGPTIDEAVATLRLYPGLDLVDLDVTITKAETFAPESVFIAFPFAATEPRFWLETAGEVYAAGTQQLPDTSKDWYSIQHAVGVDGPDGGVLWGSYDAPLVQVGANQTGRWARTLDAPSGHVNSWLMNNLHFTNFRAAQGGTDTFRYRFAARAGGVDPTEVRQFGRELLEPLSARQYAGSSRVDGASGLRVSPSDGVLVDVRPTGLDGDVRLRMRSARSDPTTVEVGWDGPEPVEVRDTTAAEPVVRRPGQPHVLAAGGPGLAVPLAAHGTVDVLLRKA